MLKDKNYDRQTHLSRQNRRYCVCPKDCCCGQNVPPLCACIPPQLNSNGIQLQLQKASRTLIERNQPVVFDTLISQTNSNISYNNMTGIFSLPSNFNYYVSWWVAVDGTDLTTNVEFSATINNIPISIGVSPQVTCQLSGSVFVPAATGAAKLSIRNTGENTIRFAGTSVQANITIIKLAL